MAIAQFSSGSTAITADAAATVVTTAPETADGFYQIWVDASVVTAGQILEVRVLEKINDTGDTARESLLMAIPAGKGLVFSPAMILLFGWDVSLRLLGGSNQTIQWSIRSG